MQRYLGLGLVCLFLFLAPLAAQEGFPGATVGVPYTFDYGYWFSDIDVEPGVDFSYSFTAEGGPLPPGLTMRPSGLISGTPTTAGTFNFSVRFVYRIAFEGQSFDANFAFPIAIVVTGGSGSRVSVAPAGLSFAITAGAAPVSQFLSVVNQSATPRGFTATASSASWLSVSGGSGTAPAFGQSSVQVTASPAGLTAGTYFANVEVVFAGGTERFTIPVVLSVSSAEQRIELSQTGLTFRAAASGPAPPTQSFAVLNSSARPIDWTAATSTFGGGSTWLSATPTTGRSDVTSSPAVQVRVNPAGLAPGDYYGQVQVSAPGVPNSPQIVSVVFTVLPAATHLDPAVSPTGLIFVAQSGGANPAAKNISVTNLSTTPLNFSTSAVFEQTGQTWFNSTTRSGTLTSGQTASIPVNITVGALNAGVYRGELTIRFDPGSARRVDVVLIVIPRPPAAVKTDAHFADGCTRVRLIPVFSQLGASFSARGSWPTAIEITAVDNCGTPMTSGAVQVSFSNGDPVLALNNLRDGRWSGTWQPRTVTAAPVTVTASAIQLSPRIEGKATVGGDLAENLAVPSVKEAGAVSAASFVPRGPVAPGSFVAIYGSNLASGLTVTQSAVFSTELNGTQALLAGRLLPLYFTSDGQINAIIPYDMPANATHQLIVRRGQAISVPEQVTIAAAQPAIFTTNSSGAGLGIVVAVRPGAEPFVVDAQNPVTAGDAIVIYCSGLGAVDPASEAGKPASLEVLSLTAKPTTLKIGGVDASVTFSGLTPGSTGLYQVNAEVPAGIAPSAGASLVITVDGQSSPAAVTIPVR